MRIWSSFLAIVSIMGLSLAQLTLSQNTHKDYLDAHNTARAHVGVRPLTWNRTLAAYARKYANTRIRYCELEHSNGPYGENIAEGYDNFSGKDAVNLWISENANYDHHSNSCVGGECLHYTQVVWRNTVHLGCARAHCKSGWWFITCNYDPPGNYEGERPY